MPTVFSGCPRKPGFSLVEMMIQMTILTAVTLPMVMVLNMQRVKMGQEKETVTAGVGSNQLFDTVVIQDSDAIAKYTTLPYASGSYYYSTMCDPAIEGRLKTSTNYNNQCDINPPGPDQLQGPFFKRELFWTLDNQGIPDNQGIIVKLSLYKKREAVTANPPYSVTSRTYQLNAFRVNLGEENNYATGPDGSLWAPETVKTSPSTTLSFYSELKPAPNTEECPQNKYQLKTLSTFSAPLMKARDMKGSECKAVLYHFRVSPNTTYDMRLYAVLPKDSLQDQDMNVCLPGTQNTSCALADITIKTLKSDFTVDKTLRELRNIDALMLTGFDKVTVPPNKSPSENQAFVLSQSVKTTPTTHELTVQVSPHNGPNDAAIFYPAAIELVRREDQP